jgi:hypothetical protein
MSPDEAGGTGDRYARTGKISASFARIGQEAFRDQVAFARAVEVYTVFFVAAETMVRLFFLR